MDLGAFSVSLSVKDLDVSRSFYEALGFEVFHEGSGKHRYVMMRNGGAVLGLFENMFRGNILTFNPGFAQTGGEVKDYTDVRELQRRIKEAGLQLVKEADEDTTGPDHVTLIDPDGNAILIDQHV